MVHKRSEMAELAFRKWLVKKEAEKKQERRRQRQSKARAGGRRGKENGGQLAAETQERLSHAKWLRAKKRNRYFSMKENKVVKIPPRTTIHQPAWCFDDGAARDSDGEGGM